MTCRKCEHIHMYEPKHRVMQQQKPTTWLRTYDFTVEKNDSRRVLIGARRPFSGSTPPSAFESGHLTLLSGAVEDLNVSGLRSGFESLDLDRPGRLPHQQGPCEARLGYRDGPPQLGAPGPGLGHPALVDD